MKKQLLLISNSTNYGEEYLGWPREHIARFLLSKNIKNVLFIPYAGISLAPDDEIEAYDNYGERVRNVFQSIGLNSHSIHLEKNPKQAIKDALAIVVGGGNTFHLVYKLYQLRLMDLLKETVEKGMPFVGWSAGSNIACPSIRTTNDMPIVQPKSFDTLSLIPFQINPHYLDANPEGHGGETREQRIEEFLITNQGMPVVGLREGTYLEVYNDKIELKGSKPMRFFLHGKKPVEYEPGDDINFLMKYQY
jgi:dipeptidase E